MPSFDLSRSRFRLSDEHVQVLVLLATARDLPDELSEPRDALRACGLVNERGQLAHALVPMMETLLSPVVVVSLEAASRQGELHHGVLIGEDHVLSHQAWPGTPEAEYALVEPKMLVWALANMVNLQQNAARRDTASQVVETTMGTVESGLEALKAVPFIEARGEDRDHIRKALASDGALAEPALVLLTDLIAELRSSWRLTSAWQGRRDGDDGVESRGLAVWDCGPLGYWHRETPAEPVASDDIGPDTALRFVRVEPRQVWQMITDLLPDGSEMRPGAQR
ncbi:histidine kinase [Streptomyces sp. TRM64462]|uniref:histidine kinase n=1 Tax=Streptomyces sp. TRM64462 TaxID=2741726 RepID=UPI0015862AA1|nr:histidine kinase [Streptomyces sp. TRM64462]